MVNDNPRKKKRKYYRHCGSCGRRFEQSEMIRTNESDNGWLCRDCYEETKGILDCDPQLEDSDYEDCDW